MNSTARQVSNKVDEINMFCMSAGGIPDEINNVVEKGMRKISKGS